MKMLFTLMLTGCVSQYGMSAQPKRPQDFEGVLYAKVGVTYGQTKANHTAMWKKANEICSPKNAIAEFDELNDLADLKMLLGKKTIKLSFICL